MLALFINYNSKNKNLKKEEKIGRKKEGREEVEKGEKEAGGPPTILPHHEDLGRNYHYSMRLFYRSYTSPRKGKRLSAIFGLYT